MKCIKSLVGMSSVMICMASCANNNQNTGGIDSASVSTDPSMQGLSDTMSDSGMSSSDSTDIRMPMTDTTQSRDSSAQ